MKNYIIYNKVSGEILKTGTCPDLLFNKQLTGREPDCGLLEGIANDVTHKVTGNGALRMRSKAEIESRRAAIEAKRMVLSASGEPSKLEKILKYLKKQGIDLGPDGADL